MLSGARAHTHTHTHTHKRAREGVSKSFRTVRLEWEMQMVQLSATRCSCSAILWVSLVSFAATTLCVASQRVFIVVGVYFVIDSVRKLLDTPSCICSAFISVGIHRAELALCMPYIQIHGSEMHYSYSVTGTADHAHIFVSRHVSLILKLFLANLISVEMFRCRCWLHCETISWRCGKEMNIILYRFALPRYDSHLFSRAE
jgi:hypothetical protein